MMRVLGKYSWQGVVLAVLLVSFIGIAAQAQSSQDIVARIQVLQSQANKLIELDQWEAAIPVLHEALQLSRTIEDQSEEASVLGLLGESYRQAELLETALTYYEKARATYAALGMASSSEMAVVLLGRAKTQASLGDLAEAIYSVREAKQLFKDQDQPREEAAAWQELGQIFFSLGRYEDAYQSFHKALKLYQVSGGRIDTIAIYQDIGQVSVQMGKYEDALNSFHAALSIAQEIAYTDAIAKAYVHISSVYSALGRYDDALNTLSQAESLYEHQEAWLELANIQLQYAELPSGQYDQALKHYRKSVEYLKMVLSSLNEISPIEGTRYSRPVTRVQVLSRIGLCLGMSEQQNEAVRAYQQAASVIETVPWLNNDETEALYQRLILLQVHLGRGADALVSAERWRSLGLRYLLYPSDVSLALPVGLNVGITDRIVWPSSIDEAIASAQASLKPNEAVIEYMVTNAGIYLWVITNETISNPVFIEYAPEQLMNDVITLRNSLESDPPDRISMTELLTSFYDKLVKPGLDKLTGKKIDTLVFIPSGPLWYLPFAAVEMSDHKESSGIGTRYPYLVERYALAYLPSLASLPALMAAGTNEEGTFIEFSNLPMRYPSLDRAIARFAQYLTGDEQHVSTYAGDDATESQLRIESSNARFLMLLCRTEVNVNVPLQSDILLTEDEENDGHLHAWEVLGLDLTRTELVILPVVDPLLPYIQQSQDTLYNPEPWQGGGYAVDHGNPKIQVASFQQVSEEMQIEPELLKQLIAGEDATIWPLTFLSAGARGVLQTLWLASPVVLERLLVPAGDYYKSGDTWAQALAKAQRDLIKDTTFNNPWLWAPYQLIGRWR